MKTETAGTGMSLDVNQLRNDFPILRKTIHADRPLIYFDNGATTQRPQVVIDAISSVYCETYANVHRGIHWLSEQSTSMYEQSRAAVAKFIGAEHDREIIFTSGTTLAINLVARSLGDATDPELRIDEGDEILLTEMEHHSNIVPWQQLGQRTGARVRFVSLDENGFLDANALDEMLSPRTKVFAFAAVSNVLGTINPVQELVARAKKVGALTVIDAAQHVPHEPTDVSVWDADFVTFSAHKMLGPSGLGILHGKMDRLKQLPPFLGGGSMISQVTKDGFVEGVIPAKFEAGTPPIAPAIAFESALNYLAKIGMAEIKAYEQQLSRYAMQQLQEKIDGIRILGPGLEFESARAGIVSFVVDGCSPQDLSLLIDRQGIAIRAGHHCAMPLHEKLGLASSCRASFYVYNTPEEIDSLVTVLQNVIAKLR